MEFERLFIIKQLAEAITTQEKQKDSYEEMWQHAYRKKEKLEHDNKAKDALVEHAINEECNAKVKLDKAQDAIKEQKHTITRLAETVKDQSGLIHRVNEQLKEQEGKYQGYRGCSMQIERRYRAKVVKLKRSNAALRGVITKLKNGK